MTVKSDDGAFLSDQSRLEYPHLEPLSPEVDLDVSHKSSGWNQESDTDGGETIARMKRRRLVVVTVLRSLESSIDWVVFTRGSI
jgi:hypothetical protein